MCIRLLRKGLTVSFCGLTALSLTAIGQEGHTSDWGGMRNAARSATPIIVGSDVLVSSARPKDAHFEVLLAADPKNSAHLLGTSIVFSEQKNTDEIVTYVSSDAGKTWDLTLTASPEQNVCCFTDPAVAYGLDGTAYLVFFGPTPEMKQYGYLKQTGYLYRSKDGGRTWMPPTKMPVVDRNFITLDNTGGKFNGRLYIHGVRGLRGIDGLPVNKTAFLVYHSSDGGATFEAPAQLVSEGEHALFGHTPAVVLSDGTLVCLFGELKSFRREVDPLPEARPSKPNAELKVITSSDGGETFSKAVAVSEYAAPWTWNSTIVPYLAADRSGGPFEDRLYVVYPDLRFGRIQILFAYSSDEGKSWSKPAVLNDDRPPLDRGEGPDHFMPVVAVNRSGVVGVMWYDRRESSNNLDWSVRFRASLDGGETFLPSVRVSDASFVHGKEDRWVVRTWTRGGGHTYLNGGNLRVSCNIYQSYGMGGDTAGLAADADGIFHPFWVDNRTGVSQVWSAPVAVKGTAIRNGAMDLASLDDISEKVVINYTLMHFDRQTNTLSFDAQLENVSKDELEGPVRARVIALTSSAGTPVILTTDNGVSGVGAVWDLTPLLTGGKLRPKEMSKSRHLEFSVSDLHPFQLPRKGSAPPYSLVDIEIKVLGKVLKNPVLSR